MRTKHLCIGTSGWHYNHWNGVFYPPEVKGYNELRFFSEHFSSVENNSSFYRISKESTYKTWDRMTPEGFTFSLKLNRFITHIHRLNLTEAVRERIDYILTTTQILGPKLGAIVVQLPPSFKQDLARVDTFLAHFTEAARSKAHPPDIAIEFRAKDWFNDDTFALLRKHNVALVAAQSSRYPEARELTADFSYLRLHGPKELFASPYSTSELKDWASFIRKAGKGGKRVYVYFNNDIGGHALRNAEELQGLLT
ncbi:MAG TPA: DUF72 domain-containing protein [Candidatus Paceibacterota bacterium]|jgi:uncharacterized protein YecE (DUF72 family)